MSEAAAAAAIQRELAQLDAKLSQEVRDGSLQTEFERTAQTVLSDAKIAHVTVRSARCGTTLCRVDFNMGSDAQADAETILRRLAEAAPHGGIWFSESVLSDGVAVAFVGKHGTPLRIGD